MFSKLPVAFLSVALQIAIVHVNGESHTVTFTNNCGYGTPYLRAPNGDVLSTGEAYTTNGSLNGAISYLQTGECGDNGEDCTTIELTLVNGDSATDISLIPPHEFSVASGFVYYNAGQCDGMGANCTSANCPDAFHTPGGGSFENPCTAENCDVAITFCN